MENNSIQLARKESEEWASHTTHAQTPGDTETQWGFSIESTLASYVSRGFQLNRAPKMKLREIESSVPKPTTLHLPIKTFPFHQSSLSPFIDHGEREGCYNG